MEPNMRLVLTNDTPYLTLTDEYGVFREDNVYAPIFSHKLSGYYSKINIQRPDQNVPHNADDFF